jgi:hypothetical protein
VVDLDGLPRRAQQHGGRAELAHGVDRGDDLDAVRRHHRHAVTGADTVRAQVAGERVGEAVVAAERPPLVPHPTASRSPNRSAARSNPRYIRVAMEPPSETLFSGSEIDVNTDCM